MKDKDEDELQKLLKELKDLVPKACAKVSSKGTIWLDWPKTKRKRKKTNKRFGIRKDFYTKIKLTEL